MKVPLLDLKAQYATIQDECLRVTREIYESQYFILGPHVEALEKQVASYCGAPYAVGVSSGTDALLISLMAAGVGQGDRVITTPYTFFATAGSIARTGAIPVFADISADTYNLSAQRVNAVLEQMTSAQRKSVKAIMPVHLYGQCADMDEIMEIAGAFDLVVIEDAAQAIGAQYGEKRAGTFGGFGCFSFFPSKNLGCFGDGGMVTTDSREHYEFLKILRMHGSDPKYYHRFIGGNFRLDALQAAIVSIKLKYLDDWTEARRENARVYLRLFEQAQLGEMIKCPVEKEKRHIYNQFVVSVTEKRDELKAFLNESGIGCEIYYPVPLHLQECFKYLGYGKGDFPESEFAAHHTLALPIYPELTQPQQEYVVDRIRYFYAHSL